MEPPLNVNGSEYNTDRLKDPLSECHVGMFRSADESGRAREE
jgi:hypothetical protein